MPLIQCRKQKSKKSGKMIEQYSITIPAVLCRSNGWKAGDELEFKYTNIGAIILEKVS